MECRNELHVVVIGGLHHNTLGVIRSLGEAGVPKNNINVIIVENTINKNNFVAKSKYVSKKNIRYIDEYSKIVPQLLELAMDHQHRVIVCCSDGTAEIVISHKKELQEMYYTPTTSYNVTELMKKDVQTSIAQQVGFLVPKSKVLCAHDRIDWNSFPCITKPIKSVSGAGKADIRISENAEELITVLKETEAEHVQIQEFLSKEMEFQLIGCSINGGEKVIIPGFTRIVRQPKNTNTGYLEYVPINRLKNFNEHLVESFIKKIGYSGLFSLEFIRDTKGDDYFLEINMRNDGNAYCVESAGVNLPFIWCYYGTYGSMPSVNISFNTPVWFIPDFYDVHIGIKECGFFHWLKQFISAESHSIFNAKDIRPFVYELGQLVLKKIKR